MSKIFPTLFEKDQKNKIKEWIIQVSDKNDFSEISYEYGYINGKKNTYKITVKSGKNIGKKNETTHFEQAINDAQSKWNSKIKSGYSTTNPEQSESKVEKIEIVKEIDIKLPMLANEYNKNKKKITFEAFIQPKLDGYRMIYNPINKKMYTRSGKEFTIMENTILSKNLIDFCDKNNIINCLDGELYVHSPLFKFENYGILRRISSSNFTENEKNLLNTIDYHIYDIILEETPFNKRNELLNNIKQKYDNIKIVETTICKSFGDIEKEHGKNLENNYEGSMIRNKNGLYKCKYRSNDLLKYKNFDDAEFEIIDFTGEQDPKSNDNLVIWICKTENGNTFNVQSKGTREERQELFKNAGKYIGKKLWVQFFGFTNDSIPRFPKTMRSGLESIRNPGEF